MKRVRLLAALAFGVLGVLALPASPASAHAALVRTSPVQSTIVQSPPSEIVITFSEHVVPVRGKIQVIGPDGKRIDRDDPSVAGDDLRIPVRTDVPRGTYLVSYRVISADSHPVGAGFTYSFGAPSAKPPQPSQAAGNRTDPVVFTIVDTSAYLGYAGLILVAGPTLVLTALWPRRLSRRDPTRLAYLGLGLIGLGALLQLYLQAPYENGGSLFSASAGDIGDVLGSTYGKVLLVRLAALVIAAPLLRRYLAGLPPAAQPAGAAPPAPSDEPAPADQVAVSDEPASADRADQAAASDGLTETAPADQAAVSGEPAPAAAAGRAGRPLQIALALLAVIGIGTWPLAGHSATTPAPLLTVISDSAHVTSMAIWLGGLVMLVGFVLRRANGKELEAILPVWSNWATLAVTVLVLAGSAQAIINISTVNGLLHTQYGLLVSAKVLVLAAVLGVAAVARRIVRRRSGFGGLRRTVLVEVLGAVLILGLTSVLVRSTPAVSVAASQNGGVSQDIFATTLDSKLYQLQLDIEPLTVGNSDVHLYAYTPDGAPLAVKEWKVTAALPSAGVQPIDVPVLALTPSHATGSVSLPTPGQWVFSFTLRTTEFDEATVTAEVTIA